MSKRILVIEDDPHIRLGLVDALTSEGYEVSECRDGGEAVPQVRQSSPDLVILDVMLPRKSGYDICRELRALKNPVPILMLTAKGQEVDKVIPHPANEQSIQLLKQVVEIQCVRTLERQQQALQDSTDEEAPDLDSSLANLSNTGPASAS